LPVQKTSTVTNIVQPPPNNITRQLPPLPTRQLTNINKPNISKPFFDLPQEENETLDENLPRTGELFYYQTSSSSNSNNSTTTTENSDNENNDQQEDDDRTNQRLQSDEDDDQTSTFEYDA
jgi:hypothetical protein